MAYDGTNLHLISHGIGAGARQRWSYTTTDAHTTVDTASYITDGGQRGMRVNDIVEVTKTDDTNKLTKDHIVITVSATSPGVVDLSDGTTIAGSANAD